MDFVVVGEREVERLSGRLGGVLHGFFGTEHWSAAEFEARAAHAGGAGVIFVGDNRLARYLRPLVPPKGNELGACWGLRKRKALVYVDGEAPTQRTVLSALAHRLDDLRHHTRSAHRAFEYATGESRPTGALLAYQFLDADLPVNPHFRTKRTPTNPSLRTRARDLQLQLAIALFLLQGFDDLLDEVFGQVGHPSSRS